MGRLNVWGGTCHAGLPAAGPGSLHPAMGGCSHLQGATAAPVLRGMPGAWLDPEGCHLGCGSPLRSWQAHCMQLRSLHLVSLLSQLTKTTTYFQHLLPSKKKTSQLSSHSQSWRYFTPVWYYEMCNRDCRNESHHPMVRLNPAAFGGSASSHWWKHSSSLQRDEGCGKNTGGE